MLEARALRLSLCASIPLAPLGCDPWANDELATDPMLTA